MLNTCETSTEYLEHPLEVTNNFNNDPHRENESAPFLTHSLPTQCTISQQNIHQNFQMFFNAIKAFEENINRQLEQVNELKNQLNQMKQSFITQQQQQAPVLRRMSRNYVTRPHPYLNERPLVSSRTPIVRSNAPTYRHECFTTEPLSSSNNPHNIPAETSNNNEIFSTHNYEFW
ncbi:hypothetical protein RclHR1_01400018 [Rhizophagus clarus]|uniref:Uncharacterized protein n=1 Tax=Rhizophagus clarus TaxID=94130 RepID=A0A2Z6QDF4_9GLOM|nr:hypothetical protein RclHR1_01400018 [Rhizophagus clarus]GES95884.1 hypothetical protein GLOIN_2v1469348 [Rhizophagus clarus]